MKRRLKTAELPIVRRGIWKKQEGRCPLCLEPVPFTSTCVDHDHTTGQVRGVLCRNCNGIEGKIKNLVNRARRGKPAVEWLGRLILYWVKHTVDQWGLLHPLHLNDDEKRIKRNTKARKRRAAAKPKNK
jgi:hypothetical protein